MSAAEGSGASGGAGVAIRATGLGRRFGSFVAVDGVSFEVGRGEIFGYLGANGAGKSTTIRMLTGLLAPTSGEAQVAGHDVRREAQLVKGAIGYMSQKFSLYLDLPVRDNLLFFGGAYGLAGAGLRARASEVLELLGLAGHEDQLTGGLPGGTRQRLALACAILHEPAILFLDEPTSGVDPLARREFWSVIRALAAGGTTVFVTTHYLDEAEQCARIGLMVDGRLVALDTPAALKRQWVPELVVHARGRGLAAASSGVAALPGIASVQPFGSGLHLLVERSRWSAGAVRDALTAAGASAVEVTPAEPSLEDVFLAVVGGAAGGQVAATAASGPAPQDGAQGESR